MDIMLRSALRKYNGLRQQIDSMLLGDDGDTIEAELRKFVAKRPCWVVSDAQKPARPKNNLLEFVSTTVVAGTSERFVAKMKFVLKKDGGICSDFGTNFKAWFLDGEGKVEEPIVDTTLQYHKLLKWSKDLPIVNELGGEEVVETTLIEMFSCMEKQKNGEAGDLLVNGYANIFYIRDKSGVLRSVDARWCVGGWRLFAYALDFPYGWYGGRHVFSRKPYVAQAA